VSSTVPLETFVLTLHVPRMISDSDAATLLKLLRRKSFAQRLEKAINEFLKTQPALEAVTISISVSP
jgi:hypothetical protein